MATDIFPDLKLLLNSSLNGSIDDFSVEVSNASTKEGVAGDLFMLVLTNNRTQEKLDLIIKQQRCKDGKPYQCVLPLFENEIHFYNNIWPRFCNMYTKKTGKSMKFIPNCFGVSNSEIKKLALQNLKTKGFVVYNKTQYFDKEHFNSIFKLYGVFHGISLCFKEQHKDEYLKLTNPLHAIWKDAFGMMDVPAKSLQIHARMVQNFFDPIKEKHLIEKLRLYENIGPQLVHQALDQAIDDGVILHGDVWSNNFMFRYDTNGKLVETNLIDFQQTCTGSPVHDLSYCFYAGASQESLDKLYHYLKVYHDSLSNTLKEFDFDVENIYSYETLKNEWKQYCKFGFAMGIMLWRLKLIADDCYLDIENFEDNTTVQIVKIAKDKENEYKERVRELVIHMYENNFF